MEGHGMSWIVWTGPDLGLGNWPWQKSWVSYHSHSSCPGPCLLVQHTPNLITIDPIGSQTVVIKERLYNFPITWNIRQPWESRNLHHGPSLRIKFKHTMIIVVSNDDFTTSNFADIIEVDVTVDSPIMEQWQGQLVAQVRTLEDERVSETSLIMRIVNLKRFT